MSLFRVYVDGALFYHPQMSKLAITQAQVQEDAESIDCLTLAAPFNHPYLSSIVPLASTIVCKKGSAVVFEGRALDNGSDFYNTHTWTCESCLAYLKDTIQPPYEYSGTLRGLLEQFISVHNNAVESKKQFTIGNVTVTDDNDYIAYSNSEFSVTLDAIRDKLIKTHGGFLRVRYVGDTGEVPQYYVENNHEAIIDPETFELVQREMARRTRGKNRHSGVSIFSGKINCGDCGGWYGSKHWHSTDPYKRVVWQCNQKYKNENRCTTPFLTEEEIRARFITAANTLLAGRKKAIRAFEQAQATVFDLTDLLAEQANLNSEMQIVSQLMQDCIRQNASVAQDQAEYQKRFDALSDRFEAAKAKHENVTQQISDKQSRKAEMEDALKLLKKQDGEITEFREGLWTGLLDYATIYADGRMSFTFKTGQTIDG